MRNTVFSLHLKMKKLNIKLFCLSILFCSISLKVTLGQTQKPLPCLQKKFNVIAHIVLDDKGERNVELSDIQAGIDEMNSYFSEICISFKICEYRNIENYQYDDMVFRTDGPEMNVIYHEEFRINMYFVTSLPGISGGAGLATLCGIAKQTNNNIWIVKSDNMGGTMAHEMGHFFGLQHTFLTIGGDELVDGSNCAVSGDSLCDTPADPYERTNGSFLVNKLCEFTNLLKLKDANGEFYDPDTRNIMSYYPCPCRFSYQQYEKMVETYRRYTKMW